MSLQPVGKNDAALDFPDQRLIIRKTLIPAGAMWWQTERRHCFSNTAVR